MSGSALVAQLRARGYQLRVANSGVVVRPKPDAETLDVLRANRDSIIADLRRPPVATDHRYVALRAAIDRARSVCLSCGIPPPIHGAGAIEHALLVDRPEDAYLIARCAPVVAETAIA